MRINLSSFLQWRINIFLCQRLGWRIALLYITILGAIYFSFKRKEKQKIKEAVASVFAIRKTKAETRSIRLNVFRGILLHYWEKLFNAFSTVAALKDFFKMRVESEGLNAIEEGLARGSGVLFITGHFGGVEFIPGYLASKNFPVTILARFASDHLRDRSIQKADKFATRIIDVDHTPNITKAILNNLRENRIVITECDEIEEWRPSPHHKNLFLEKEINLDRTVNILMKRVGAAVVFGIMHRNPNNRYKLVATSWEEMARRFQSTEKMSTGAVVLKFLEEYIYKHPEQWYQWKKYAEIKTVPSGEIERGRPPSLSFARPTFGKVS